MTGYYEHHLAIKKDKLCPFKLGTIRESRTARCNWHNNIEILHCFQGCGAVQYGKDTVMLNEGDIVVMNSGVLHRPYSKDGMSYHFIIIDESFCLENGVDTSRICFDVHLREQEALELFTHAVENMQQYRKSPDTLTIAKVRASMLNLLIHLISLHSHPFLSTQQKPSASDAYTKKTLEYLNEHYSQPIALDALADLCGITKCHLSREFKRATGLTVLTYVNILRCKKAEMLLSEGKTVTETAIECGFDSLAYFSKTYKKITGSSPSESKKHSFLNKD